MKCPYCLEQINDGAFVCRFCGKNQPLTEEAKKEWWTRHKPLVIASMVFVVIFVAIFSDWNYQSEQQRLQAAATCNGTLTAGQLEEAAKDAAAKSGISVRQAEHAAEAFACPAMAAK